MDTIVAAAERHGIELLPIVAFSPEWASDSGELWAFPRTQAFEEFFSAALRRYPRIAAWELWNEPNFGVFAKPRPDPAGYVQLLRTAHRVRAMVGSRAKLISGGLAPGTEIDIVPWIEEMARLGGLRLIDGLGVHPYSPGGPDQPGEWMMRLEELQLRLAFLGRPGLPLWLTEYGAPASPRATGWGPALTEEQQADRLRRAFTLATQLPFVENLTWYEHRDSCPERGVADCIFGLRRHDGAPRPAHHALRGMVDETLRLRPELTMSLSSRRVSRLSSPAAARARSARRRPRRIRSAAARRASRRTRGVRVSTYRLRKFPRRGRRLSRATARPMVLEGRLVLPASPSSTTPMSLLLLERGAEPRVLNLSVRGGDFRVRVDTRWWRRGKIVASYAGSSVYEPVQASLDVG